MLSSAREAGDIQRKLLDQLQNDQAKQSAELHYYQMFHQKIEGLLAKADSPTGTGSVSRYSLRVALNSLALSLDALEKVHDTVPIS